MARALHHSGRRRRWPRLLPAILLAGVLCAGLLWGLGSALAADPSASPAADKVVLHVGWTNDPDNLNPFIGAETSSYEIWLLNYDFLTGYSTDLQPVPDLATSWDTSADGKTWTFHLRTDVKWQDGVAFTAKDVAFTYNYIIDNQMGAYSSLTDGIDEAVAVDDQTVEIRCSRPKANMVRTWIPILPEHIWSKVSPKAAGASYQNKPPIVGTGPFQTVEVKKGDYVRMVANPTFWGKKPAIDEILFVTYQNPDTMTQDLLAGTLDAAWGIPSAQFPKIQADESFTPISYNLLSWTYLAMNCYEGTSRGNPVLRDPAFRVALNWALDRQKIVDLAWAGRGKPGSTIMTPDSWVDPDYHWQPPADVLFTYDPAKAKQLLDEAGYKDADGDGLREDKGGEPIRLRLWARAESPESQKTGSLLTGWLRDLGLKIDYQVMDDGIYYDSIWAYQGDTYSPDFDMYLWTRTATRTRRHAGELHHRADQNWNEPCWSDGSSTGWSSRPTPRSTRGAQGPRLEGAGDLLRAVAGDRDRLPGQAGGGQHGALGRLDAHVRRHGRRLLHQLRAGQLPEPHAEGRRGRSGRRRLHACVDRAWSRPPRSPSSAWSRCSCSGAGGRRRRRSDGSGGASGRRGLRPPAPVHLDPVLARALGRVERGVGARHQVVHVAGHIGERGDSDADPDAYRLRPLGEREPARRDHTAQALGDRLRPFAVPRLGRAAAPPCGGAVLLFGRRALDGGVGQDDGELLAAVAGREVDAAPELLAEQPAQPSQRFVPGGVAAGVVELLEVVDVDHEQRHRRVVPAARAPAPAPAVRRRRGGWPARSGRRSSPTGPC